MGFMPERLKEIVEGSGVSLRQNTKSFIFTCPRCNKKDKLYIRKSDGKFVCFVCVESEGRFKGHCEYALAELLGQPVGELRRKLYGGDYDTRTTEELLSFQLIDFYGEDDEVTEDVTSTLPTLPWPMNFLPIAHPQAARGLRYLEQERGIPLLLAQAYGLRYCPPTRRVIFPIEVQNRLVGWQARSIVGAEPKILGNTDLRRDVTLMFGDRLQGSKHAVVCEGPIDGIKAHLCEGNVVTMGKAISDAQLKAIRNSGVERVYLAIDPDAAAEMARITHELGDLELYHLLPARGRKDLGEMSPGAVLDQFRQAPRIRSQSLFIHLRC